MELPARFGLIGDVHAHDAHLERALEHVGAQSVDCILCVGDIVDGEGDPDRCAELLREAGAVSVRGNHDRWILQSALRDLPDAHALDALRDETTAYLRSLPTSRRIETVGGPLLLGHGVGDDDMVFLRPYDDGYAIDANDALQRLIASDLRWAVGGHTHQPMDRTFGDLRFINPGTVADLPQPTCAVLDVATGSARLWALDHDGWRPASFDDA